jgi:hypothetical protein
LQIIYQMQSDKDIYSKLKNKMFKMWLSYFHNYTRFRVQRDAWKIIHQRNKSLSACVLYLNANIIIRREGICEMAAEE